MDATNNGPAAAAEEEEEETPLFMTRVPSGPSAALDALAAIIDDEDEEAAAVPAAPVAPTKRRKRSLGECQVTLALACVEDEVRETRRQRRDDSQRTRSDERLNTEDEAS